MQLAMFAALERYEVRYRSLVDDGCLSFPCDPSGAVELDSLDEHARLAYLYARALIVWRFASPVVVAANDCTTKIEMN